jgi:hypothetical protein
VPEPPFVPPPPVAARQRALAERLLDDERLRGDLDDATWAPIQDWLLRVAGRVAARTDGLGDAAAQPVLDQAWHVLTALVGALTSALAVETASAEFASRVASLAPDLQPPVVDAAAAPHVGEALRQAARQLTAARADGPTAAARLVAALETRPTSMAPPGPPRTP